MFRLSSGFSTQPVYISVEEWAEKPLKRTKYSGLSELIKNQPILFLCLNINSLHKSIAV